MDDVCRYDFLPARLRDLIVMFRYCRLERGDLVKQAREVAVKEI